MTRADSRPDAVSPDDRRGVRAVAADAASPDGTRLTARGSMERADIVVLALFAAALAAVAARHELGLDEAHAWNLARAARFPWDVIALSRVEGHTPLWYLVLWPFAWTGDPRWMQGLTVASSVAVAALLLRDRPLPRLGCVLILLGFYIGFRYSIVPRTYALTLLFSALLASRLHAGERRSLPLGTLCGLVAMTGAYGILLSAALALVAAEACVTDVRGIAARRRALAPGALVYLALVALASAFVVLPVVEHSYVTTVLDRAVRQVGVLDPLTIALFPHARDLPLGIGAFLTGSAIGRFALAAAAVLAALAFLRSLRGWRVGQLAWLVAIALVLSGGWLTGLVEARYSGHVVLAALVLVWSRPAARRPATPREPTRRDAMHGRRPTPVADAVVLGVLLYHVAIGLLVGALDVSKDVSHSRAVAGTLGDALREPWVLITARAFDLAGALAYLDKEAFDVDCDCVTRLNGVDQRAAARNPVDPELAWCRLVAEGHDVVGVFPDRRLQPDGRHETIARFAPAERFRGDVVAFRLIDPEAACAGVASATPAVPD